MKRQRAGGNDQRSGGEGGREQGEQALPQSCGMKGRTWVSSSVQSSPLLPSPCPPASGVDLLFVP